jgi:pyruvate dehydrogenase E2 component (dihydrolipoamide acetyltransferase)
VAKLSEAAQHETLGIEATCTSINAYDLVVTEIMVAVGDAVAAEQILMTLEYTKVVTEVTTPSAGIVAAIHCQKGDEVQVGDRIIDIHRSLA